MDGEAGRKREQQGRGAQNDNHVSSFARGANQPTNHQPSARKDEIHMKSLAECCSKV
jgi:hypothetical protein